LLDTYELHVKECLKIVKSVVVVGEFACLIVHIYTQIKCRKIVVVIIEDVKAEC